MSPNRMRASRAEPTVTELLRKAARPETNNGRRALTAQLYLSPGAMVRLLSVSGKQSEFILSAVDGRTTVRVGLSVSTVPDAQLAIGECGMILDWSRSTLSHRGSRVTLTRMELRLLLALLENAPNPVPYRAIIDSLWGADATNVRRHAAALPVWVCSLRRRMASIGLPSAVRTARRFGYSLVL
jgi:DNA-binding response OmpR family regulator